LKIKYLRTDNGGEYAGDLLPLLKEMGIIHEHGPPHSPQSNGKTERLNRTLNKHVRSMLFQANMLKSFWAEAMATAAYLINRLPNESINNAILYELWYEKPLDLKQLKLLKPFGCKVNNFVPKNGDQLFQNSIQGQHSVPLSAIIPQHHTKSGISNRNASSSLTA